MKKGFTLIELLIVIVIIVLLFIAVIVNWKVQINRAHDSLRKKNLNDIKRAFEEYYNDHNCYPSATILDDCGGTELQPYLTAIPCDPDTGAKYYYVPINDSNLCQGYRAFTKLLDTKDTDITMLGCNGITGCGFGPGYNYGISSGAPVALPGFDPGATPMSTQGPQPGENACSKGSDSQCKSYSDPSCGEGGGCCPQTWATDCTENGVGQCQFSAKRCTAY